jgi:streptogramin lyase
LQDEPEDIVSGFGGAWVVAELAVIRIDSTTHQIERIATQILGNAIAVGDSSVWAAASNDARLLRINPAAMSSPIVISLPTNPTLLGMTANNNAVWITDLLSPELHTVDVTSNAAGSPIPLAVDNQNIFSGGTWDVSVSAAEGLWVTGGTSGQIFQLTSNGRVANEIVALSAGEIPNRISVGHGRAWVQLEGTSELVIIDAETGNFEILSLPDGGNVSDIEVSADAVWVVRRHQGGGLVLRLDPDTLEVTHTIQLSRSVTGGSRITVDSDTVWVTHPSDTAITIIAPQG